MDNEQRNDDDILGRILVWCAITVMVILTLPQMLGGLLAWPLERHRHKSAGIWLAWNFLRLSVPIAICIVGAVWLLKTLADRD